MMPEPPPWPDPRMIDLPGASLATYDLGGEGPPVLFAHATGFCGAVWAPMAAELPEHRRMALDLPAHGRSVCTDGDLSWSRHARDLLAVVEDNGLKGCVGVGHSMGGAVLLLAEQASPGTFSSLWLWEPIVFPRMESGEGNALADGATRRRARFDSDQAAYDNFAAKRPLSELCPAALAAYVRHGFRPADGAGDGDGDGAITLCCRPEDEAASYREGARHDAWEHLGAIDCPVTVLRGAASGAGADVIAPGIAEGLPHGRLEEHPELGHFGPLAAPESLAASLRRHIDAR